MKVGTYADTLQLLEDMRDYARKALAFSHGKGLRELVDDEQYRFSIPYALQVVGEAASRVPQPVRSLSPDLP
jgi:uncharacterized protein with HEPN domain